MIEVASVCFQSIFQQQRQMTLVLNVLQSVLFYGDAIYFVKSQALSNLGQFVDELDEIRYKSRITQGALAHQISSGSDEK